MKAEELIKEDLISVDKLSSYLLPKYDNGMIEDVITIVLFRDNLRYENRKTLIKELSLKHFSFDNNPSISPLRKPMKAELVIFVDKDGKTKILKSRWGNLGIVK